MPFRTTMDGRWRISTAAAFALCMLLTAAGCARTPKPAVSRATDLGEVPRSEPALLDTAQSQDALNSSTARRLLAGRDPIGQRVALQLLLSTSTDAAQRRWLRARIRKLQRAKPDDVMLAMARALLCDRNAADCDAADLAAWPDLEPDNAAALMASLARADGKDMAVDDVLSRMADGTRYDSHFTKALQDTMAALDRVPLPPPSPEERDALLAGGFGLSDAERREYYALTVAFASSATLPFAPIARACRPPVSVARFAACRTVLMRMAGGSTMVERLIGIGSLVRLTEGTAESAYWREQQRRMRWIHTQLAGLTADPLYRALLLQRGEADAVLEVLARRGRLDPPPGWASAS